MYVQTIYIIVGCLLLKRDVHPSKPLLVSIENVSK